MSGWPAAFPLEDSLAVLNPAADRVHLLNPTARAIWHAVAAGLRTEEIATALATSRGCSNAQAQTELEALLHDWKQEGLLSADARPEQAPAVQDDEPHAPCPAVSQSVYAAADIRLHDLLLRLQCGDAEIWQAVLAMYAHLVAEPGTSAVETVFTLQKDSSGFLLFQDDRQAVRTACQDELLIALSLRIADAWHQRRKSWLLIAHAAGLVKDNACILLPAAGGSGKSTLAAFLLQRGFSLLSDDIVPILRSTGRAVALPCCLHIKQGSLAPLRQFYPQLDHLHPYPWGSTVLRFLPPPNFQQAEAAASWPVKSIIFPCYVHGATTQLASLTATETFQRLITAEPLLPKPLCPDTLATLLAWVQERPAFSLRYSSLDEAAAALATLD